MDKITDETAARVVGVENGRLEKVVIESSDIMVSLNLTSHVMVIQSKSANMLVDLLDGLKGLHHLSSFVQHLLLHCQRLPWRYPLLSGAGWSVHRHRPENKSTISTMTIFNCFFLLVCEETCDRIWTFRNTSCVLFLIVVERDVEVYFGVHVFTCMHGWLTWKREGIIVYSFLGHLSWWF